MTRNQHAPIRGVLGSFLVAAAFFATSVYAKDQASPEVAPPAKPQVFEDSSYTKTNEFFKWTRGGRDPSLPSPFSGIFIEAAGGYSYNKLRDSSIRAVDGNNAPATFDAGDKRAPAIGRFSLGLGYTLPYNTNLTITGSYSTDQEITPTMQLKNVFDARFQPGYYIVPARLLLYTSVGYAWARVSDSGIGTDSFGMFDKTKLNALVLGGGLKFSPVGKFYMGLDYSYIKYRQAVYNGNGTTNQVNYNWTRNVEPRSSAILLTMGYYFF